MFNRTGSVLFVFDGTSTNAVDLSNTFQCVQGNGDRSISFMIQTTTSDKSMAIIYTGQQQNYQNFQIITYRSRIIVYGANPDVCSSNIVPINDGIWHFVLVTYSGNDLNIRVDDESITCSVNNKFLNTQGNNIYLGYSIGNSNGSPLEGMLKNVKFFSYVINMPTSAPTISFSPTTFNPANPTELSTSSPSSHKFPVALQLYSSLSTTVFQFKGSNFIDLSKRFQCAQGNNPWSNSFKIQTSQNSIMMTIIYIGVPEDDQNFAIVVNSFGCISVDLERNDNDVYTIVSGNTAINDGIWHSVLVSYDTLYFSIYIDGQLDNTTISAYGPLNTQGNNIYLGNGPSLMNHPFLGSLKNVQLYNYVTSVPISSPTLSLTSLRTLTSLKQALIPSLSLVPALLPSSSSAPALLPSSSSVPALMPSSSSIPALIVPNVFALFLQYSSGKPSIYVHLLPSLSLSSSSSPSSLILIS